LLAWIRKRACEQRISCFQVVFALHPICRRDSTPASFVAGSAKSGLIRRRTALTRCAAPRLR
jgi:hypothetical protein